MTSQNALTAVLVIAILGWIIYRQNQWRRFDRARMWRAPLIPGIVGAFAFARSTELASVHTLDIAVLVFEGVLSLAVGAVMGVKSRFSSDSAGGLLVRTGLAASALWLVLVAVRVGIDVAAIGFGATAVASGGVLLALLALNRLGRVVVIAARADRLPGSRPLVRAH